MKNRCYNASANVIYYDWLPRNKYLIKYKPACSEKSSDIMFEWMHLLIYLIVVNWFTL